MLASAYTLLSWSGVVFLCWPVSFKANQHLGEYIRHLLLLPAKLQISQSDRVKKNLDRLTNPRRSDDYFGDDNSDSDGGHGFNPVDELGVPDAPPLFTQSFALRRQASERPLMYLTYNTIYRQYSSPSCSRS
jgi:hypothetical protein